MKIYTITLNPAIDLHLELDSFVPESENYIAHSMVNSGGKGVNVSRALDKASTAYIVIGKENASEYEKGLNGLNYVALYGKGSVRQNITLHPKNTPETRVSAEGAPVNRQMLDKILSLMKPDEQTIAVFSGRIPVGLDKEHVLEFLHKIKAAGALLAIDCNSLSSNDLLSLKPWLIKPNRLEAEKLFGSVDALSTACRLHESGIENCLISLGKSGALLVCSDGEFLASAPRIKAVSTIGAGDAMLAGYISAYPQKCEEMLRTAVAFGTAACLTPGTLPPKKREIEKLIGKVKIERL